LSAKTPFRRDQVWEQELLATVNAFIAALGVIKTAHEPALREVLETQGLTYEGLTTSLNAAATTLTAQIAANATAGA
jgi:hypothetical protein